MRVTLARWLALLAILGLAATGGLQAQSATGYFQLTVGTTVVTLSATPDATVCRGTLETAAVRIVFDGSTPTATLGQPVSVGDQVVLGNARDIANFKAIRSTAISGLLNMTCSTGTTPIPSVILPAPFFIFSGIPGSSPPTGAAVIGGRDGDNVVRSLLTTTQGGLVAPPQPPGLALPTCDPVRRYQCQAKSW